MRTRLSVVAVDRVVAASSVVNNMGETMSGLAKKRRLFFGDASFSGVMCLAIMFAVAGPAIAVAQAPVDWNKVEADAKKEGKVVMYTSSGNEDIPNVLKKFEARYGIQTELLRGRGSELRERIRTEFNTKRNVGDVVSSGNTLAAFDNAVFDRHPPLPNAKRLISPFKDDGLFLSTNIALFTILLNTNLVKPGDEPKSWLDVLDPKWKGKILLDDPRATGQGNGTFMVLADKFGHDFLEKIVKQEPVLTRERSVSARRVAQGEFAMYFAFGPGEFLTMQGLPIKVVVPKEGAPYTSNITAKLAGAPHPNAALLLMNFLLEDEAQDVFADLARKSVTGRVSSVLPDTLKEVISAPLLAEGNPDKVDEMLAVFNKVFSGPK